MTRPKLPFRASRFSRLPRLKAFWRADKGSAAVEFAMVAIPFFMLLGGVVELGLVLLGQVTLDNAMQIESRNIRTGLKQSAVDAALQPIQLKNFKGKVCAGAMLLVTDCMDNVKISIDAYPTFASVPPPDPVVNGKLNIVENYNTGPPGGIVVVRAYYPWTLVFPVLSQAMQRVGGKTLLTSIVTFANEPFTAAPPTTVTPDPVPH